jgi:hypothetical protein
MKEAIEASWRSEAATRADPEAWLAAMRATSGGVITWTASSISHGLLVAPALISHSSMVSEGMTGFRGRATSKYGFALVNQPVGFGQVSFQAISGRFQLGEGSLDATNILIRASDGFRGLADQIGDPIRLGQIGTFILFEFDIGVGMAAGKQRGNIPISCAPCQLIPGNLRHVHGDDRKIKACRFNSLQSKAASSFAPHPGAKLNPKEVGQKVADAGIVFGHQYRGHGFTRLGV